MNKKYRKAIVAGNWKMNKLAREVPAFLEELSASVSAAENVEIVLCVPYPFLPALTASGSGIAAAGAQDVSVHDSGAYTGEVSASMLADLGVRYAIVGHSERREYHAETDEMINAKLMKLLDRSICPILCVGESLSQRDGGEALPFVASQIRAGLAGVSGESMERVVIAYEPIWAIGTGRTATAEQSQEICAHIRGVLEELYGVDISRRVSILYGGSMNAKNAGEMLAMPDIDGGLIGGASLKPADFAMVIGAAGSDE